MVIAMPIDCHRGRERTQAAICRLLFRAFYCRHDVRSLGTAITKAPLSSISHRIRPPRRLPPTHPSNRASPTFIGASPTHPPKTLARGRLVLRQSFSRLCERPCSPMAATIAAAVGVAAISCARAVLRPPSLLPCPCLRARFPTHPPYIPCTPIVCASCRRKTHFFCK